MAQDKEQTTSDTLLGAMERTHEGGRRSFWNGSGFILHIPTLVVHHEYPYLCTVVWFRGHSKHCLHLL